MSTATLPDYTLSVEDIPIVEAAELSDQQRDYLKESIARRLHELGATLVAHYYVDGDIQDLAEATGGFVSDSLEMARFGHESPASTLVVSGVRFMGETAKILNNEKRVLMPDLKATCSLDEGCPIDAFSEFCDQHPDHTVVVYANTSAEVKARSDWVVTSGIALDIVQHLADRGDKILWAPDKHLGRYVQQATGAEMIFWPGSCVPATIHCLHILLNPVVSWTMLGMKKETNRVEKVQVSRFAQNIFFEQFLNRCLLFQKVQSQYLIG